MVLRGYELSIVSGVLIGAVHLVEAKKREDERKSKCKKKKKSNQNNDENISFMYG